MKRGYPEIGALVLLAFFSFATPGYAQTAAATTKSTVLPKYDVSKEVTLNATVESAPGKSSNPRTQDFLVLQTKMGSVNGELTPYALNPKWGISISSGEQVKVTGLMMTSQNKQVFVIRTLQAGGRTYQLRNERGFPLAHVGQNSASSTESKGGQL
jgi:hypothetical protein